MPNFQQDFDTLRESWKLKTRRADESHVREKPASSLVSLASMFPNRVSLLKEKLTLNESFPANCEKVFNKKLFTLFGESAFYCLDKCF